MFGLDWITLVFIALVGYLLGFPLNALLYAVVPPARGVLLPWFSGLRAKLAELDDKVHDAINKT